MPTKRRKNGHPASQPRKDPAAGKKERPAIRPIGTDISQASRAIADSIYTLKLSIKSGAEVFAAREGFESVEGGAELICSDLWESYKRVRKIFKGESVRVDILSITSNPSALSLILEETKKILPVGWEFNINYNTNHGHHFVIFRECPWQYGWSCIPIMKAVTFLRKENRSLHDLFLSFLSSLRYCGGINLWIDGYADSIFWELKDRIEDHCYEMDPEDAEKVRIEATSYISGEAKKYEKLILSVKRMPAKEMGIKARRFRKCSPIANLISQGAKLLEPGFNLSNYDARHMMDDEDMGFYLPIDEQCTILWDEDDYVTHELSEYLDSLANEGLQEPVHTAVISKKTRKLDFERFEQAVKWPMEFSNFIDRANELIKQYVYERANTSPDEAI